MKTIICIILIASIFVGCGSDETADQTVPAPDNNPATMNEIEAEPVYLQAASNLVGQFSTSLKSELMRALNEGGASNAVRVCAIKGQELVATHSTDSWSVKRVSEKWRNIEDRPDTAEINVLEQFEDPTFPESYLTRWSGPDSARQFHYYKKIIVAPLCLQCHGDLQTVDLDLWKEVKVAYPYDKATGYNTGDLRGMFVVTGSYPDGLGMAQLLAEGASMVELAAPDTTMVDPATVEPSEDTAQ